MKQIEAQAILSAADKTGNVFAAVAAKIDRLAAHRKQVDGVGASFISLAQEVDRAAKRLEHLQAKMKQVDSLGAKIGRTVGAVGAAYTTREIGREAVKAGAEGAHERARMEAAGMTPEEMREAEAISARLSGQFKSISQTTILHLLRNARAVTGSFEEASHIMEPLLGAYTVAMGSHPEKAAELFEEFDKLVKGQEIVGVTQNLPRFVKDMDLLAKALNVFGDTLKPGDFYEFAKYARQAGPGYSDKFLLGVAPTLMQEMGGKSAGEALASFYQQFVSGKMPLQTARLLQQYGLIDPSKIQYTKAGLLKTLLPGAVKGSELARADPYRWINEVLLPALAAKGITGGKELADVMAVIGSKRTTGQVLGIFAQQQSRIEKDLALEVGAKGLEAVKIFAERDPFMAWRAVTEQFTNLLQAASSPLAMPAANALNAIAAGLNRLTEAAKEHPAAGSAGLIVGAGAAGLGTYEAAIGGLAAMGWITPGLAKTLAAGPFRAVPWLAGAAGGLAPITGLTLGALQGVEAVIPPSAYSAPTLAGDAALLKSQLERIDERIARVQGSDTLSPVTKAGLLTKLEQERKLLEDSFETIPQIGGEATVTVKVEASDDLKVKTDVRNSNLTGVRIGTGTTGSTGKAMPEAAYGP